MNNHQNAIFHQITNFLKTPLALLGVDLKNFQFNKICHFANHPYLCKGLYISFFTVKYINRRGGDNGSSNCCKTIPNKSSAMIKLIVVVVCFVIFG
ncbi:MAG: hypothetical protein H0A76_06175 [Candidatus Thiodubiliella endoseptemdiera]|uniref:Uncharacterized protein n=1 Tax=Candidatus Thiodubiliella endoseptemdiera TaxID=2738886 RepID=A0A853F3E7_9GAMM|nr:hypothetical protein [Candidatus Thiodubiliella endoseptemdiera]